MGMRKRLVVVVVGTTLSACAPAIWDKPGATEADFKADHYNCEKDARQSGYFGGGVIGAINMHNFFEQCMVAHGWTKRESS